ncbi:MAG TPA: Rrf2 family transcriptional regulator [Acetobacteraceae bacterium]|jgi:Rrf2 family nitric oxide-sensitive transcriptional repressor
MRLTAYTDFTLRMLMYLALRPERSATVGEIAGAYGISVAHLNKVVQQSALAGEIETARGRNGGIRLAKPPEAINLAAVVRRTEPDMDLAPCFADRGVCVLGRCCLLEAALRRASKAFLDELRRTTLADLIGPGGPSVRLFSPAAIRRSGTPRKQALAGATGRRALAGAGRRCADA